MTAPRVVCPLSAVGLPPRPPLSIRFLFSALCLLAQRTVAMCIAAGVVLVFLCVGASDGSWLWFTSSCVTVHSAARIHGEVEMGLFGVVVFFF